MQASRLLFSLELTASNYALLLLANLPSSVAYGLGRMVGDLQYQVESSKRKMTLECLELAFGEQTSPEGRIRLVHDCFRLGACRELDRLRLTGRQGLAELVKIQGLEHIEYALAQGKGAVIGSAHFGSFEAEYRLLGALGFPVTVIAARLPHQGLPHRKRHWPDRLIGTLQSKTRRRHRRLSNIFVDENSRSMVPVDAARKLERNELIFIMTDVVGFPSQHPHTAPIPFLNGLAYLPTGAVRIAKSAGAPLLFCLIHRSRDWRHQMMEISAPIPTEGDIDKTTRHCVRLIEDAIRREPANWRSWDYKTMAKIGLLPEEEMKRLVRAAGSRYWD